MIGNNFTGPFWTQYLAENESTTLYESNVEWVLSLDGVIEHVSYDETHDLRSLNHDRLPMNWEIT